MNKADFVGAVADTAELSKADAGRAKREASALGGVRPETAMTSSRTCGVR